MKSFFNIIFSIGMAITMTQAQSQRPVKVGADLLFEKYSNLIDGKKVGLITNHSGLLASGIHTADALMAYKNTKLVALFGPEHGVRGDAPDGLSIQSGIDSKTSVPVYSLYGKINKPTPEMLNDIDVLVYDIQDVGARFYTFISTLFLGMEAAAEQNIPFVVLDRPNPIRGIAVEGPLRDSALKSFVGWAPIPVAHGMTVGELGQMANGEGWLKNGVKAKLTVVRMEGWKRTDWYDETTLQWIRPSPNMATMKTAVVYPGTCFVEGTNVSEGRGSEKPFEYLGAPWMDGKLLANRLNEYHLPGVHFEEISYTPVEIAKVTTDPKYEGVLCHGIYVNVADRNLFTPVKTGVAVITEMQRLFPKDFQFRDRRIDLLTGTSRVREMIVAGATVDEIVKSWTPELTMFTSQRAKYLIY